MTKIDIYGGKNPRDLPLYAIAEAARVVRIHPATLRTWVLGRSYATRDAPQRAVARRHELASCQA